MKRRAIFWIFMLFGSSAAAYGQATGNIYQATLSESAQKNCRLLTEQLKGTLADNSAEAFLDARPHLEYAISHIPGAMNVAAKPGSKSRRRRHVELRFRCRGGRSIA